MGSRRDLVSNLKSWYKDTNWENLLSYPWRGDESAFKLSDVYTDTQIETYTGREKNIVVEQFKDPVKLFKDMKEEGTRILVKGEPGCGKTTLTHLLAYEWAKGRLQLFDAVFVIKLKFTNREQSIEGMIVDQISSIAENATAAMVGDYLKSGRDKVLLILDGLDEIPWKKYSTIQNLLQGDAYKKCCILLTTRPHIAEKIHNKMSTVARILGFTREKAQQYVSHIIDEEQKRRDFFKQLDTKQMSGMARVPILLQALALIFDEGEQQLPKCITSTYDELFEFLRKTCKASRSLTEEELNKAIDDVNELAYKGLIREDRQLIFDRDEIKNKNIYNLGVLSAEKIGSGFNPTEKFQFLHKTLQEHAGADHVVKRIKEGDWEPWWAIDDLFKKENSEANDMTDEVSEACDNQEPPYDTDVVRTAVCKFFDAVLSDHSVFMSFMDAIAEAGAFEEEFGAAKIENTLINDPALQNLEETEKHNFVIYFRQIFGNKEFRKWHETIKHWVKHRMRSFTSKIATKGALKVFKWTVKYTEFGVENLLKEICGVQKRLKTSKGTFTHFKSFKTLFCFIIGKLPLEFLPEFVTRLNELIVLSSYNPTNMEVARIEDLRSAMSELVEQAGLHDLNIQDLSLRGKYRFVHPALLYLGPTQVDLPPSSKTCDLVALHVCGSAEEDNSTLFQDIIREVKTLNNIYIAEIKDIPRATTQTEFTQALCKPPLVSLRLDCVATGLVIQLLRQIPNTLERLAIFCDDPPKADPNTIYPFLPIPNLKCLHLLNCRADLSSASFPKLRSFILSCSIGWKRKDATLLRTALTEDRMGEISNLEILFTSLKGSGPVFADILTLKTLRKVQLVGVKFSLDDGRALLRSLKEGKFRHLQTISLLNNKELAPVAMDFELEGDRQNIDILIIKNTEDLERRCMHRLKEQIAKLFSRH